MKSLVWLRNDLRIDDNPALRHACANSDEVHCIYIFSKEQMKIHNETGDVIDLKLNVRLDVPEEVVFWKNGGILPTAYKEA